MLLGMLVMQQLIIMIIVTVIMIPIIILASHIANISTMQHASGSPTLSLLY